MRGRRFGGRERAHLGKFAAADANPQRQHPFGVGGLGFHRAVAVQPGTRFAAARRHAHLRGHRIQTKPRRDGVLEHRHAGAGKRTDAQLFAPATTRGAGNVGDQIRLVPHFQHRHPAGPDVVEHGAHVRAARFDVGGGGIDHVQHQVGLCDFLERRLERLDERHRQSADEAHGVRHHNLGVHSRKTPHGGVQRGEQPVFRKRVAAGKRVEQSALAGVGVAGQRHRGNPRPSASAPALRALAANVLKTGAHLADAPGEHALVQLQLRLAHAALGGAANTSAGAAPAAAANAGLPVQVRPTTHEAGLGMR